MRRLVEGIYLIENRQTHQYLDLTNGEWDHGHMRTSERARNPPRLSHVENNQRWLVTNVPDTNEYQIINLHYGVFTGKLPGQKWDDWHVKAGIVGMVELGCRWLVEDVGDECVRFAWRTDSARSLGVQRDVTDASAQIQPSINHPSQHWRLHLLSLDSSTTSTASWMSAAPAATPLTYLNIPGTHQSLSLHGLGRVYGIADFAQGPDNGIEFPPVWKLPPYQRLLYGGDNSRCQNRAPYEQLCEGIRYLDLSFDRWTSNKDEYGTLYSRHGIASLGYTLTAVLQSLRIFLRQFPSETVILQIRNETHCAGFEEAWTSDYSHFSSIFYQPPHTRFRAANLTLGDVRGKVVCPAMIWGERTSIFSIGIGPRMPANPHYAYIVEDSYDLELKDTPRKIQLCRANIERAGLDTNPRHWYKTAFNMSIFSKYNPIDAVYKLRDDVGEIFEPGNGVVDGQRIGIVCFDFYEYCGGDESCGGAVGNIIASNRHS